MLATIVFAVALPSAAETAVIPSVSGGSRRGDDLIRITAPLAREVPIESSAGAIPSSTGQAGADELRAIGNGEREAFTFQANGAMAGSPATPAPLGDSHPDRHRHGEPAHRLHVLLLRPLRRVRSRQKSGKPDTSGVMAHLRSRRGADAGSADRAAFSALFAHHYPAVWRFVARRAWPDAVDDVVAETFLAAWRRYDDLPSDALPWLLNAAGKCLANHRRAAIRAESLKERLAAQATPVPADATTQNFERAALLRAFASLPDTERTLLMLTDWDELPVRSAARALGISSAAASARIYRARRKLRAALAAELGRPAVPTPVRSLP